MKPQHQPIPYTLAVPAGAVTASRWRPAGGGEVRTFVGEAVNVFEMSGWLALRPFGYQFRGGDNDGYIVRTVELLHNGSRTRIHLLPEQAEQLATALNQAALVVERLDGVRD